MDRKKSRKTKKLKVLVTGAAGFLGRYIVDELDSRGCDVVALVKRSTDTSSLERYRVRFQYGDVRDRDALEKAMEDVDVVVHAAATFGGGWDDFYAVNVESTRMLLEIAAKQKIKRFVHISSVSVYDHVGAESGTIFTEETPFQTEQLIFYAQSKIEAEQVVQEYSDDVPCVMLRPGALYGIGGELYPAQLGLPLGGARYGLVGNGDSTIPLCHVKSVAKAVWLSIKKEKAVGQAYNLTEDDTISRIDYLEKVKATAIPELSIWKVPYWVWRSASFAFQILFKFLGKKAPLRPLYLKMASRSFYYPTDKIKKELGWQPSVDFDASIDELLQYTKRQRTPSRNFSMVKGKVEIPSSDKVNVGIVGCGGISGVHLDILQAIPNANIVALADPVDTARRDLAKEFGVPATYSGLDEMLNEEQIDVIHILSPAQFHAEQAVKAIESGCHVLVEKPMALNTVEAKKIMKAAQRKKVKLCVGHNHLYDKAMIDAREIIAKGSLGRITYVESWYGVALSSDGSNRALAYDARDSWFYKMPGSLYQDFISHPISLLTDIMGEVRAQKTAAKYFRVVPHMQSDELRVLLDSDDMLGSLCVSLATSPRQQFIKVYGTKGTLTVDLLNKYTYLDGAPGPIPKTIARGLSNIKYGMKLLGTGIKNLVKFGVGKLSLFEGTERMIRLFYRSVLLDEAVPVTPEEGLASMRLMDEIWGQLDSKSGTDVSTNGKVRAKRKKKTSKKVTE